MGWLIGFFAALADFSLIARIVMGALSFGVIGALLFTFGPQYAKGYQENKTPVTNSASQSGTANIQINNFGSSQAAPLPTTPNISFQKYALFWVEIEPARYQLGIVLKLFNLGSNAHLIKGIKFERETWKLIPRGSYYMRRYTEFPPTAEIVEDNYIKGNSEGYYKHLLPIYIELTINGGDTPDMAIKGRWTLQFDPPQGVLLVSPGFHATYEKFISSAHWQDLLKPKSAIVFEDIHFQRSN